MELPAHLEITPVWHALRADLRRNVGDSTFEIWLAPLRLRDWDGSTLTIEAPDGTRAWVSNRFSAVITRCARASLGPAVQVELTTATDRTSPGGGSRAGTGTARRHSTAQPPLPDITADAPRFIPRYTFDQFIIGDGNRLAHAAALAVAENPGQAYNPLFLHAPPGLGKTHLLHAIGNFISNFDPSTTVRYTTVEAFTNGFLRALNAQSLDRFKDLYRNVDVLLIDDVQFLAMKAKTEEEFFHTFNTLHDSGRQLVLTCDRLPRQLTGLEDRLRARFEAGLVAEIAPPDRATRIAILRKRAALDRVQVAEPAVLDVIADRVTDNVRALEGALIRVVAHTSLAGGRLDAEHARQVLGDPAPGRTSPNRAPTPQRIQEVVAAHFQLPADALASAKRTAHVAWARQLAIQLTRELTDLPLQAIGDAFGGRNHATVLHACARVANRVANNPEDAADLDHLRTVLRSGDDRGC